MKRYTVIMAIGVDAPDAFPENEVSTVVALCLNDGKLDKRLNDKYDIYLERLDQLGTAVGQIYFR